MNALTQKMMKTFSALDKKAQEEVVEFIQQKSLQHPLRNNHANKIATVQKSSIKRASFSNKQQKQVGTRTAFLNRCHTTQQNNGQETEGQRMLRILEEAGLIGCIKNGEPDLAENYEKYLWSHK